MFQIPDLETLWIALNEFFERFTATDWTRRHGNDWEFGDIPFHLGIHNELISAGLSADRSGKVPEPLPTLRALKAWNDRELAAARRSRTGREGFDWMRSTQDRLRDAVAETGDENGVLLPIQCVRGCRTLEFALEYSYWHLWLHFAEAHLRYGNWLPGLPDRMTHSALTFQMEVLAAAIEAAQPNDGPFVLEVALDGTAGGTWTFACRDNHCMVSENLAAAPDLRLSADIAGFLKTYIWRVQPLRMAVLRGGPRFERLHGNAPDPAVLFQPPPDRPWPVLTRGLAGAHGPEQEPSSGV